MQLKCIELALDVGVHLWMEWGVHIALGFGFVDTAASSYHL